MTEGIATDCVCNGHVVTMSYYVRTAGPYYYHRCRFCGYVWHDANKEAPRCKGCNDREDKTWEGNADDRQDNE